MPLASIHPSIASSPSTAKSSSSAPTTTPSPYSTTSSTSPTSPTNASPITKSRSSSMAAASGAPWKKSTPLMKAHKPTGRSLLRQNHRQLPHPHQQQRRPRRTSRDLHPQRPRPAGLRPSHHASCRRRSDGRREFVRTHLALQPRKRLIATSSTPRIRVIK